MILHKVSAEFLAIDVLTHSVVSGVTPCCGVIEVAITPSENDDAKTLYDHYVSLRQGVCPKCHARLYRYSADDTPELRRAKGWFTTNARTIDGLWSWSANDAAIAFAEIHGRI